MKKMTETSMMADIVFDYTDNSLKYKEKALISAVKTTGV